MHKCGKYGKLIGTELVVVQKMKDKEKLTEDLDIDPLAQLGQLSYRQLIWRRFRKSKLGLASAAILSIFYIIAIGASFFAPYHYNKINMRLRHVPPQNLHFSWSQDRKSVV